MSAKAILDAVWTKLAASTLYTTLGGRIALNQLPADTRVPLLVYGPTGEPSITKAFGGIDRYDLEMEFTFYQSGSDGTTCYTLSDQLLTGLTGAISPTGFDRLTVVRSAVGVPSFSDDCWSITDRYRAVGFKTS
jgi:hypothetical protein